MTESTSGGGFCPLELVDDAPPAPPVPVDEELVLVDEELVLVDEELVLVVDTPPAPPVPVVDELLLVVPLDSCPQLTIHTASMANAMHHRRFFDIHPPAFCAGALTQH